VKVFRALRALLSGMPKPLAHDLRELIKTAAAFGVLYLLLNAAWEYYRSGVCLTEVLANISGISGLDFEINTTDCWHSTETGVFVSKPGQKKKTLLFLYDSLEVPTITSVDERTIQIALGEINSILCRRGKWENLTIKYDIRGILYPGSRAQPQEC
jgi:hypothetical protein